MPAPTSARDDERKVRILRLLAHAIRYEADPIDVLQTALEHALDLVGAQIGTISYADMLTQRYVLVASRGLSDAYVANVTTWSLHEGLAGQAFGLREPLAITDLEARREVPRHFLREERLRGYVCVPLLRGPRRLGIIEAFEREPRAFAVEEIESLEIVAAFVSSVVESMVIAEELRFLRDERARVLRQWTTQALTAADAQRAEVVRTLLAEADAVGSAAGIDGAQLSARLRHLAASVGDAEPGWVDIVPLLRESIADRWGDSAQTRVTIEVDQWPPALPLELTSRLYLLIYGLVAAAVQAADSRVALRLDGSAEAMWVQVGDDRPRAPGADPVRDLPPELTATVRGLDGCLQPSGDAGGLPGIRVVLPLALARPELASLTSRERRVLEALTPGSPNRAVAAELGISPKTLQNHLTAIYRKLGVTSRAQAMRLL